MKLGIIGLGTVGSALYQSFSIKCGSENLYIYDKYKNINSLDQVIQGEIIFLCLPTVFDSKLSEYDKSELYYTCQQLQEYHYSGVIVIKSTIEPGVTDQLSQSYSNLHFIHNPEFLTARTAFEDVHHQTHIVLGKSLSCPDNKLQLVEQFYQTPYPDAKISICSSQDSESMKLFCNCFYSVKIQFFTELYLLCQHMGCNFDTIRDLMLNNGWINPMHTNIPGPDGQISYGGLCFPKDTNALNSYMDRCDVPHAVLSAVIKERELMRSDKFK